MPNFASSLSGAATDRELARRKKEWTHNELPKLLNDGMIINREAPMKSTCGFCQRRFEGKGSWDVRMEHVGRHYEMSGTNGEGVGVENWSADSDLVEWADENGIVVEDKVRGGYKLAAGGGKEAVVEGTSVRRHIGYYG